MGITIYGCGPDEAALFREIAPGLGVVPTITPAAVSDANIDLAAGNRCISIGHKSQVTDATLRALRDAGVTYISTRSVGDNHIDVNYAASVGIFVETVVYSPDSVADYTVMLMLMTVRLARAQETGAVRTDVTDGELLALAAGLAWAAEHTAVRAETIDKLLSIAMRGLEPTAPAT